MGLPSSSVQAALVNATVAPVVTAALAANGASIFGAGVLGANFQASGTPTLAYTVTNNHEFNLNGTNSFTLGLLTMGTYNSGFKSLAFTLSDGSATLLSDKFTSLSAAQAFFTDDAISLGKLTGAVDLTLTYKLVANAPEGAGISYVIADAPSGAGSKRWITGPDHSAEFSAMLDDFNRSHAAALGVRTGAAAPFSRRIRPAEFFKDMIKRAHR